ncbi:AraC family transcriptional regulator, partial [Myroides pelagicus]|nr:AraC family transcriptional regulator [Myroides pelagicus]
LIQQLINHPYQGKLAEHYLNNKVEEAHLLQYHNWRHNKTHNNLKLHQKDKQALYDIKSYITKHFNKDFTIQELALKAGI